MAKFKFRMQGYLNIKQKLEDQRKQEYGLAVAAAEREKQKKQALIDEKEARIGEFRDSIDDKIDSRGFTNYNNYIEFLKKQVILQDKRILEAQKTAEIKRLALVEAMKERKMLEKLSEKQYEQYLIDEKIAEQKITDEIISYRFDNKS